MNSPGERLNLLVLNQDPDWCSTIQKVAEKAELKNIKFLEDVRNATAVVRYAPNVVLWNIKGINQFDYDLQDMILDHFPNSEIVVAVGQISEEDVVSLLQVGVTYICDKEEGHKEFSEIFLQFLGVEKEIRNPLNTFDVSYNLRNWVDISAPSEAKFVESIVRFVSLLMRTTLDDRKKRSLAYALREIGQNAIEWGNAYDPLKFLHLSFCVMEDRVMIKFQDEGEGFNPTELTDPKKDPLATLIERRSQGKRCGGYGIAIVRGLMDEVIFSEKGNSVVMVMNLETELA